MGHCQECAQACRRCADECRRMAGGAGAQQQDMATGATAH
ncbi:four-helix bundle copper-binding protein [Noviherbaspirillum album]|nr:four-helix bundle copper-binding protein [Noviherbaspirillum sp. CPCC 100848]